MFFLLAGYLIIQACTCSKCAEKGEYFMVPDSIINRADSFVISKTGREFFDNYIHFDYQESRMIEGKYYISYIFRDLEREYIDEKISFLADTTGKVLTQYEVAGIPECKKHPEHCDFSLTEDEVIKVADSENFSEGINGREISFRWSSEFGRYVWHVLSVEEENGSGENYKGKGGELIISPSDGSIIATRKWNVR